MTRKANLRAIGAELDRPSRHYVMLALGILAGTASKLAEQTPEPGARASMRMLFHCWMDDAEAISLGIQDAQKKQSQAGSPDNPSIH